MKLRDKKNVTSKVVTLLFSIMAIFGLGLNTTVNAFIDVNDLFKTDKNLIGKPIFVPIHIRIVDYSSYGKYKQIKIVAYDGFNEKTVYDKETYINSDGLVNILVAIDPNEFNIDRDMTFKVYVGNELYASVKKPLVVGKSLASSNTKYLVNEHGKVISIDNLLLKSKMNSITDEIKKKIDKYKKQGLLAKENIQRYVILKNGKLDFQMLPFSMNNLACNIQEPDLQYIENKLHIHIDRTKITYGLACKDGMTDLHVLLTIIRAFNSDPDLLKNYK